MADISIGQVWTCPALDGVPPLMCIVGKVDHIPGQKDIVSVTVVSHPAADRGEWPTVWHMPLAATAFQGSGLTLSQQRVEPTAAFLNGYASWLSAFQEGRAGWFSVAVSKAYKGAVEVSRASEPDLRQIGDSA